MGVGKKRGGKNWTKAEIEAREAAAADLERADDAKLKPPQWLSKAAIEIWNKKIEEIAGLNAGSELLDALDSEILAAYCDAVVNYSNLTGKKRKTIDTYKLIQSYHRILNQTADRLGFTPGARARLIRKRADAGEADTFGEKFD
jgi:P27 family predicted phage terminase small subunit